jgi:acetoin utilization protein AcuB
MEIKSIMSKEVVTLAMDDSLRTIREIFVNTGFHHLLVVENDRLCGIISDRDLLKQVSPFVDSLSEQPRDVATLNKRAHQIMSRQPITIMPETNVEDAVRILLQNNVSCLPVISSEGHIAGIVTWKDLLKAYLPNLAADT